MTRRIYRKVRGYYVAEDYISVNLECGHEIRDYMKNKWNIGDNISCGDCIKIYEKLEKIVTNETDENE